MGGALWWENYGASTPELQRLAIRILSQNASSSPIEQLWSVFSHVASKKRSRLLTTCTSDLVYVSANLRLLAQVASGDFEHESFIEMKPDSESDDDDSIPPDTSMADDIHDILSPI